MKSTREIKSRKRISLNEIRDSYSGKKKANEKKFPFDHYIFRPLSFYLTWLLLPLGISANQVTVFSFFIALAGCVSLCFGYSMGVYIGSVLLTIFWIFDDTDGNIARVTGTSSPYGKFLDSMVGTVMYFAPFLSLGIALYNTPDDKLTNLLTFLFRTQIELGREVFLFLGIAAAISVLLSEALSARYSEFILGEGKGARLEEAKMVGSIQYSASVPKLYIPVYLIYANVKEQFGIWSPWLLVAAFTKSLSIFIAFYAVVYLLDLLIIQAWHIYRIKEITSS